MANMANFDVSRILIEGGSSCDIVYAERFKKLGWKGKNLSLYEGFKLQAFNDIINRPWGCVKIIVTIEEETDTRIVDLKFWVVQGESVYNYILVKTYTKTLDVVASSV